MTQLPRPELAASVGVQDAAGNVVAFSSAASDGVVESIDGQRRGHPVADRVADDSVTAGVLERAAVELALGRPMLGDVGEPDPVRGVGGEHPLHVIVEHGRAGLGAPATATSLSTRQDARL